MSRAVVRVLAADDDPTVGLLLPAALPAPGFQLTFVGDGEAAVSAARAGAFDLVLLDMEMPGLDGLQAARAIRSCLGEQVPLVLMSGRDDPAFLEQLTVLRLQRLAKPIDWGSLAGELQGRLSQLPRPRGGEISG